MAEVVGCSIAEDKDRTEVESKVEVIAAAVTLLPNKESDTSTEVR